jgi:hypothetical protein
MLTLSPFSRQLLPFNKGIQLTIKLYYILLSIVNYRWVDGRWGQLLSDLKKTSANAAGG